MKTAIMRGVPLAMQHDGWWLGGIDQPSQRKRTERQGDRTGPVRLALLVALIALSDALVWQVSAGVSLALFCAILGGVAIWLADVPARVASQAGGGVALAVLPLVELVQPLSVVISMVGLSLVVVFVAGIRRAAVIRSALRLWWVGPVAAVRDGAQAARQMVSVKPSGWDLERLVKAWAVPVILGGVFALLLLEANPVLDRWSQSLNDLRLPEVNLWRGMFWGLMALLIWPCLVTARLHSRLMPAPARQTVRRVGVINAGSVARSLVLFNAMFAVQTVMDIVMLYGDAGLPEGMSHATYAHRGAYPLLVTALLAGLFAVLARPFAEEKPLLRVLLLAWLAQTLALVLASVVRLDTYVDVYGLTRLRLAAFVWMGMVAAGLGVVVWQVAARKHNGWMLLRSGGIGVVTIYVCAFINFDGIIARHNLTQEVVKDSWYICRYLGEGALPAVTRHEAKTGYPLCPMLQPGIGPELFEPADWREWGFRNARLRRSLQAIEARQMTQ
ncbi:DUF4173 domain-containing protein [Pseudosulfitobacter sp. DSM 107133]|uniref:DUF4153 domain-containing protein n=1 Tax=Pseudosulfitobacter sp. DSM 107133 TaxID=2883100 RepID=UPI000DF479D5|nr:DUF4173 domain-containing protein [Pseudosulfitobacter sp. DSM 107133]UOA25623.1 hypothetical protein DSM107133_00300 [Pseudosulfitobacter sp. DSM 107133]